jgi:uncharacterized phiE125 gp8 family phage protein
MAEPLTLAEAKAQVNVVAADTAFDDYLTSLIPAARRYVENRSGITILQRQFTEVQYPVRGRLTLNRRYVGAGPIRLTKRPIVSIDSIAYKDNNGANATYTGARFFPGQTEIFPALGELWPSPYSGEGFTVTYTAGLSVADLATDDYANLLHAMKLLIGHWFARREPVTLDERGKPLQVPLTVDDLCDQMRELVG